MTSQKTKNTKSVAPPEAAATTTGAESAAPAQGPPPANQDAGTAQVTDPAQTAIATAVFAKLDELRVLIPGLATFAQGTVARRGTGFVSEKYFALVLQTIDQSPALQKATGIDTAAFRKDVAFVTALSPLPAACLRLIDEVAAYLDTLLLARSKDARNATAWLAWKAKKDQDANAAKIVTQLRAMPKGRGVTIPKKKKRAANGTSTPKATKPTKAAKGNGQATAVAQPATPETPAAAKPAGSATNA